mmetsp:Transcript_12449/g.37436  ORF Transcript_12449/g.37436 Transcript_12449/m.37436 type:complete len:263 (+) Transcript_12449:269-1057(+)
MQICGEARWQEGHHHQICCRPSQVRGGHHHPPEQEPQSGQAAGRLPVPRDRKEAQCTHQVAPGCQDHQPGHRRHHGAHPLLRRIRHGQGRRSPGHPGGLLRVWVRGGKAAPAGSDCQDLLQRHGGERGGGIRLRRLQVRPGAPADDVRQRPLRSRAGSGIPGIRGLQRHHGHDRKLQPRVCGLRWHGVHALLPRQQLLPRPRKGQADGPDLLLLTQQPHRCRSYPTATGGACGARTQERQHHRVRCRVRAVHLRPQLPQVHL